MEFTTTELIWIKVVMEERYEEYADAKNEELKKKQYEDAEIASRYMSIMVDIIEKIREQVQNIE